MALCFLSTQPRNLSTYNLVIISGPTIVDNASQTCSSVFKNAHTRDGTFNDRIRSLADTKLVTIRYVLCNNRACHLKATRKRALMYMRYAYSIPSRFIPLLPAPLRKRGPHRRTIGSVATQSRWEQPCGPNRLHAGSAQR